MGRRFNDEPINLIRRIPTPEQLEAARPAKPTFGQLLSQKGAAFVRSAMEAFSSPAQTERQPDSEDDNVTLHDRFNEERSCLARESECRQDEESEGEHVAQPQAQPRAARSQSAEAAMSLPQPASGVSYEEEIGELRTFLLRQQQDIVRLAAQIQELKAIVLAQQQVLLCFEKESEMTSAPFREERVASAVTKGNTLIRIRQQPVVKEKATAEKDKPTRASLNL
ncbi:MAG: hypothetical protein NW202_02890 [Nitrospira sp.]|nr:hypothetical protein [Nitrospira sp.]